MAGSLRGKEEKWAAPHPLGCRVQLLASESSSAGECDMDDEHFDSDKEPGMSPGNVAADTRTVEHAGWFPAVPVFRGPRKGEESAAIPTRHRRCSHTSRLEVNFCV
jgi:hypothetical protein